MELKGSMISDNASGLDLKDLSIDELSARHPVLPESLIENAVNWLELPVHLTYLIADKCAYIQDLIRFGAVCVCWQSVYTEIRKSRREKSHRQPPLLMLPTEFNPDDQTRSFYSLSEKRVSQFEAQVPHNCFCQGSSYGWLVVLQEDKSISLLNPFLLHNNEIQLPPSTAFERIFHAEVLYTDYTIHNDYMTKAVLSSNPLTDPDFIVMAIHGAHRTLAFCRSGDKAWTNLDSKFEQILDIIYHRDQFYVVDLGGEIFAFDLNHSHPKASLISTTPLHDDIPCICKYIVESSGELLQIRRFLILDYEDEYEFYTTFSFDVHKLDITLKEWVKVRSLGNQVLFLGDSSSMSLSTLDFPEYKPNCIYFTDDHHEGYCRVWRRSERERPDDMGIFHLEDGEIEPYYKMESDVIVPPIWIEPMLW